MSRQIAMDLTLSLFDPETVSQISAVAARVAALVKEEDFADAVAIALGHRLLDALPWTTVAKALGTEAANRILAISSPDGWMALMDAPGWLQTVALVVMVEQSRKEEAINAAKFLTEADAGLRSTLLLDDTPGLPAPR